MMLRIFTSLLASILVASFVLADDKPAKSLDDQLLDDLSGDLLPGESTKPATKPAADKPPLDDKLLDQLGEGEDIELGPATDPLTSIGKRMRTVETLIGRKDTSARTQDMQKRILLDLDALLEQTKKQCQQCKNPSSGSPKPSSSQANNQPKEGEEPKKDPKDSTERQGKPGETAASDAEAMDDLVKQVWGHLPPKIREQMQNASVEEFLPKYEKLIEAYYKRLAEEEPY